MCSKRILIIFECIRLALCVAVIHCNDDFVYVCACVSCNFGAVELSFDWSYRLRCLLVSGTVTQIVLVKGPKTVLFLVCFYDNTDFNCSGSDIILTCTLLGSIMRVITRVSVVFVGSMYVCRTQAMSQRYCYYLSRRQAVFSWWLCCCTLFLSGIV